MSDLLASARASLRSVFGFDSFRPGQEEVVRAILAGEDVLAVMPTETLPTGESRATDISWRMRAICLSMPTQCSFMIEPSSVRLMPRPLRLKRR